MHLLSWPAIWSLVNSREFGGWVWFERLSWVVALAGFPFLVYQVRVLLKEQRRLADELSRRPVIDFGFLPDGHDQQLLDETARSDDHAGRPSHRLRWPWARRGAASLDPVSPVLPREIQVEPNWPSGQDVSTPLRVTFAAVNVGTRTARNVVFNLSFGSTGPDERKIARTSDIHPGVFQTFPIELRVPSGLAELPVQATASMDDTPAQRYSVVIRFKRVEPRCQANG